MDSGGGLGGILGGSERMKQIPYRDPDLPRNILAKMVQILATPKELTHSSSITLTFTFFRGDLRTSLTLDVGEDDTLKPSDQCEHEPDELTW